jgi:hypothetical protein
MSIYFTHDVAFQASNNLTFGFSILGSFTNVGNRGFVISHPHNSDAVERGVSLPVATSVQSESVCFATRGWYWTNATEFGERCFRFNARGVIADQNEHFGHGHCGDSVGGHQARRFGDNQLFQLFIMRPYFFVQSKPAPGEGPHCGFG